MKTITLTFILISGFIFFVFQNSFSQIGNIDTSHVLLSTPEFDYKNPQFDKTGGSINYSIQDCILSYEKWSSAPVNSIIAVRFMKYNSLGTETELTDNTSLNINPTVAYNIEQFTQSENNPGAVAFQSDRNGNWDIYISFYNTVSWSTPTSIGVTAEDEIEPCLVPYQPNNNLNYLLTFKRGSDIYIKNFFNGAWKDEVNLTFNDSLDCFSPEITKTPFGSQNEFFVAYNRKISADISSIAYQRFFVNTDGSVNNILTKNISQQNTQTNIRFSNGVNFIFLNYDYDTLGRKNFYSAGLKVNDYQLWNQTTGYTGDNFGGTGSSHGDVTSDYTYGYSLFSWIRRINDSTQIVINSYYDYFTSRFHAGDANAQTFVNTSTKLVFGAPYTTYRIRVLWEKEINGRTALIESFRDSYLTSVTSNTSDVVDAFSLSQNYPNPFNPVTLIRYSLSENRFVTLKVFDVLGNEIATLINEKQNAGNYNYQLSTVNYQLPSGVYFYKLEAGDFVETKRMILLK